MTAAATPVAMPRLGMTMREGRVVAWALAPGAAVTKGAVLLVIESDKAELEIEAPASGFLRHVYVGPEETVACGTLLAAITATADEPFDAGAFRLAHRPPPTSHATGSAGTVATASAPMRPLAGGASGGPPAPVTPAARVRARELGIDLARVPGSGPGGRVTREDVEAFAAERADLVVVADGIALEVPVEGEGDPILLLPGFGTDVAAFALQVPALAARWRVLGVNPRGVGRSDAPDIECYDVATGAADAAAVADTAAHVIGASLGAAAAIELAATRPERVRALVLLTPFVEAGARLLAVVDAWCRIAAEAAPETLALALVPWLFSPTLLAEPGARARMLRGLATAAGRVPAPTLARQAAGLRAWSGTHRETLERVTAPTLVVVAEDDLLTPDGAAVATAIAGAELVTIPRAGHAVGLEAPDAVNEAILGFLAAQPS